MSEYVPSTNLKAGDLALVAVTISKDKYPITTDKTLYDYFEVVSVERDTGTFTISLDINCSVEEGKPFTILASVPLNKISDIKPSK